LNDPCDSLGVDDGNDERIARVRAHAGLGEKERAFTELRAAVGCRFPDAVER
jgi:hypothetical protein